MGLMICWFGVRIPAGAPESFAISDWKLPILCFGDPASNLPNSRWRDFLECGGSEKLASHLSTRIESKSTDIAPSFNGPGLHGFSLKNRNKTGPLRNTLKDRRRW